MRRRTEKFKKKIADQHQAGVSAEELSKKYQIPLSTVYSWIANCTETKTRWGGHFTPREVNELKNENRRLKEKLQVIAETKIIEGMSLKEKLELMAPLYGKRGTRLLCEAFNVDRGTFLNHVKRSKGERSVFALRRKRLEHEIMTIYEESHQTYGAYKITVMLRKKYHETVSRGYVSKIMQSLGIHGAVPEKHKDANIAAWRARREKEDLLHQAFTVDAPNKVWASDIKMVYVKDKRYYICVILDLYSRKVIAWRTRPRESTNLVTATFMDAYKERSPKEVLILHTDRGGAYTSYSAEKCFRTHKAIHSYSHKGNPQDNAVMEAFFSRLEAEELTPSRQFNPYHSVREFLERLKSYITFYNHQRIHTTLNDKTPEQYEQEYWKSEITARQKVTKTKG